MEPSRPTGLGRLALPSPRPGPARALLALLALPLIFWRLGSYTVVNGDEALYQDVARHMLESGNWLRLVSGGEHRLYDTFVNAPLQYWLRAVLIALLGDHLWVARLPSAVLALASVLATHRMVAEIADRRAAFAAGFALLTTYQFLYLHSARTGELETAVCLILVCAAHRFIRAIRDPAQGFLGHHLWLALLLNVKAPTVAIPLLAELAAFALLPVARRRFAAWLGAGLAVLPLALAWHVGQAIAHRDEVLGVWVALSREARVPVGPYAGVAGHALFYLRTWLFGAFPYSLLYPLAVAAALARLSGRRAGPGSRDALAVLLLELVAIGVFFSAISKMTPWYAVPAYPFFSALLGIGLARLHGAATPAGATRAPGSAAPGGLVLALLAAALSGLVWLRVSLPGDNPFADHAYRIPTLIGWRDGPAWGVPGLAAAALLLLWALRRAGGAPALAAGVALPFAALASWRVAVPLAHLEHQTPVSRLHAELEAKRQGGEGVRFPVKVPKTHPWIARYYFAHEYRLERADPKDRRLRKAGPRRDVAWLLFPRPPDVTPHRRAVADAGPEHLVLLIADTLRADKLGSYGSAAGLTPRLDAWARDAVVFEQASAHAPWTLPSIASILTGRLPGAHGAGGRWGRFTGLDPALPTLPQLLARAGFDSAAVVNVSFLTERFGLTAAFDEVDADYFEDPVRGRSAAATTAAALAWLDRRRARGADGRFLLLVHYFDPHIPYDPPDRFRRRFAAGPGRRPRRGALDWRRQQQMLERRESPRAPLVRRAERLYDGEVAYLDSQIGRLLDGLAERRLLEPSLVVLTSDHGEEFLEHGGFEHGHSLHAELLHVPLLLGHRSLAPARVAAGVGHVDLLPTLCRLLAVPCPDGLPGRSLLPANAADAAAAAREGRPVLAGANLLGEPLHSLRDEAWKLIAAEDPETAQLYDWRRDPLERRDLAPRHPETVSALRRRLAAASPERRAGPALELPDAAREQLEMLGYVGAEPEPGRAPAPERSAE